MEKILIKQVDKCYVINLSDIIFCKASKNYSIIQLQDQKSLISSKCLTKLVKELNDDFLRISQSCLVNMHYIAEIIPQKKQMFITTGENLDFTIKYSDLCFVLETRFKSQTKIELVGDRALFFGQLS